MPRYIRVTRPQLTASSCIYLNIANAIDGEFDGFEEWAEFGEKVVFEVIEMSAADFENLPEFEGW